MSFEMKESTSRSANEFDPATLRVNQMRASELEKAIASSGGIGRLIRPRMDLVKPTGTEQSFLDRIMGMSAQPVVSPYEQAGFGALQDVNRFAGGGWIPFGAGGAEPMPGTIVGGGGPGGTTVPVGVGPMPSTPAGGFSPAGGGGFPDLVTQGIDTMMRGTAPTIVNQMTAAGLGRSGAVGEALARAGSEMTLPLLQQALNARLGSAQGMAQMGTALGQNLAGREANRLLTGLDAAGFGRQAMYNEAVTRPSSMLMSLITGMPTFNAPLTTKGRTDQMGWGIDLGQIIGAVAGAAMCWVAEALYGKGTAEHLYAKYWITIGWQGRGSNVGRFVYRKIGKPVAWLARRSKLVRRVLKPLFDRAVRAGRASVWTAVAV